MELHKAQSAPVEPRELDTTELDAVNGGAVQGPDGYPGCGTVPPQHGPRPHLMD
jgi:hypothetical protein